MSKRDGKCSPSKANRDNNQARDNERAIPKSKVILVSIGGKDTSENHTNKSEKVGEK